MGKKGGILKCQTGGEGGQRFFVSIAETKGTGGDLKVNHPARVAGNLSEGRTRGEERRPEESSTLGTMSVSGRESLLGV